MSSKVSDTLNKPLVTIVLFSYNQESYIRDAAEAALAQSYEPLEVILSDDASPDKTYSILEQVAQSYTGPHRVVLNKNAQNLGIGGHVNTLMEMANGELIVMFAGDDVAFPNRIEVLVQQWLERGKPACISSSMVTIDSEGERFDRPRHTDPQNLIREQTEQLPAGKLPSFLLRDERYWVRGSTAAWSKKMWETFGPMEKGCDFEDQAFSFRAFLLGQVELIDDALILYRIHDGSMLANVEASSYSSTKRKLLKRARMQKKSAATYDTHIKDLERWKELPDCDQKLAKALTERFEIKRDVANLQSQWWEISFWKRLKNMSSAESVHSFEVRILSVFGLSLYSAFFFVASVLLSRVKRLLMKVS